MGYGINRGFGYANSPRPTTVCDIAEAVMADRERFPDCDGLANALSDEIGELADAMSGNERPYIYDDVKQIAAKAIRIMEEFDPTSIDLGAKPSSDIIPTPSHDKDPNQCQIE